MNAHFSTSLPDQNESHYYEEKQPIKQVTQQPVICVAPTPVEAKASEVIITPLIPPKAVSPPPKAVSPPPKSATPPPQEPLQRPTKVQQVQQQSIPNKNKDEIYDRNSF